MFEVNDIPPIDGWELQQLIAENVQHEEFLFFRFYAGDEQDYFGPDSYTKRYECFCTACRERFTEPHSAGPASKWRICPRCGRYIHASRWPANDRREALAGSSFAFHFFQRGQRGEVWMTSLQVRMNPDFLDCKYAANEYARYVFFEGGARKWIWKQSLYFGAGWKLLTNCNFVGWTGFAGNCRANVWALPSEQELRGTCLQYSQLEHAYAALQDLPNYLALYCKYPAAEYLWKMGLGHWLREREHGWGHRFRMLVNLRAKTPDKLFRGLDKADIRLFRRENLGLAAAFEYRTLKSAGAARPDKASAAFASALAFSVDWSDIVQECEIEIRQWRKYIERQSRRAERALSTMLIEHRDYLDQLRRLGIYGDRLPDDLHEAHARLSERERRLANRGKNEKFRTRRRLLGWMCWRYKGMLIRPVDSAEEIVREGEEMHNCVAGYADRHADGETIIMVLRRGSEPRTPWHTVEIDPKTLECRQCYAARNHEREPEAAEFMERYLDHLREVTKMIRRSA